MWALGSLWSFVPTYNTLILLCLEQEGAVFDEKTTEHIHAACRIN